MAAAHQKPGSEAFKEANFFIDKECTFVNHGAFGGAHKSGMAVAQAWREHCEKQPLAFVDRQLFAAYTFALWQAAQHVGSCPRRLVFTPNCTTGMNAVLGSIDFSTRGVYMLDIGYGSVKKMTEAYAQRMRGAAAQQCDTNPAVHLQHVPLPPRTSWAEDVVALVADTLDPRHTALAVFDHITSNTALVLPVQRLVQLCHARGVPVLIDGAHAWGSTPLHLDELGADFYVTNGHKWLCCPKGVALLYVRDPQRRTACRAPIVSHGWDHGFHSGFVWDGCRDYAGTLAVPYVLQWWRKAGPAVTKHVKALKAAGIRALAQAWGTGCMAPLGAYGPMALIQCPLGVVGGVVEDAASHSLARSAPSVSSLGGIMSATGNIWAYASVHKLEPADCHLWAYAAAHKLLAAIGSIWLGGLGLVGATGGAWKDAPAGPFKSEHGKMLQDYLHYTHALEVPVKCLNGWLYVRVSFAAYNCARDYQALAEAVCNVTKQGGIK
jgi:selenocysteine lyase/cysteine desulfurase